MREGWEIKAFDACIEKRKAPTKLLSSSYQEKGLFPIVSQEKDLISGYWDNPDDLFVHRKPVVVFGDHTMVVKYIDFDFVVGADGVKILEPKDFLLPKYFYYWVSSVHIKSRGYARHFRYLREASIPIPSIPEQQRIVDILDREFAKIDALKANAEKSLQAAKAILQATLKKELEPKEGWSVISIGSVASLITKGASPKWQGIQYVSSGGILFITSENVREGFIDISLPKYVETAFNGKQARSILQKDDVLVNIVGASIGRAAVYTLDVKDANVNQAVALVRLNKDRVFPDYLCCFLNSKMAEAFYTSMKKDTARANLSLENISNIVFPCPKDITEQKAVAKKLHYEQQLCRQVENNYQKTLTLCDDLKQSLLRKAFNGEL